MARIFSLLLFFLVSGLDSQWALAQRNPCLERLLRPESKSAASVFGVKVENGRVVGRNGDPVVAGFDLDETFVRVIRSENEARALRRDPSRQIVTVQVHGAKLHYEVLPGMVEALQYLEKRGVRITFFSAGDPDRNRALLKAIRMPKTNKPLFTHIEGRLISPSEIKFNLNPRSSRPDIVKPVKPLGRQATADVKHLHADSHNAFLIDDVKGASIHQVWIPSPMDGGPPYDWKHRGEYILGCFSAAVHLSKKNPGLSLGAALKKVQTANLLDPANWENNPLIRRGRLMKKW